MSDSLSGSSKRGIEQSSHFFILATRDYVQSLRDPEDDEHHFLIEQISYAKSLNKPTIICLEKKLSQEDRNLVLSTLGTISIVGRLEFDMDDPNSAEELATAVGGMMKK